VEGVFETDHGRAPGVSARDLDGVLDRLCAARQQQRFLGRAAGRQRVQLFGEPHVALVRRHHEAGVQEAIRLRMQRGDHARLAMPGIETADAAREIEVAVAVHILDDGAFGATYENGRQLRDAAWHGPAAALGQRSGARSGDGGLQMNRGHGVAGAI